MPAADNDPGTTRVMPTIPPAGVGGPPSGGIGSQPPGAGGRPPKGGTPTWLIVLVAVLGGLVVGGVIVWLLMGSHSAVPTALTPGSSTVATPTTTTQSTAETTTVVTPPTPSPAQTKPEADTAAPNTPKFKFPPNSYWLSESNMKVEIRWAAVSDPSGVSYVLEFSQWLGGGAGWTDAVRTAPVKRLYYERTATGVKERYRIIAIDGAGNESDPSAYQFLVQAPSASDAASLNANYTP
jgi:hypothetical protein